jgi:tRNA-specific adenosine deaminase 3
MTESKWRPILPDCFLNPETPVIEAFVCTIKDPKCTGKLIEFLNNSFPEPKLNHLKRINSNKKEGKLQALLTTNDPIQLAKISDGLKERNIPIDSPYLVSVPAEGGKTIQQHKFSLQLWPVQNFCADKYLESVLAGKNFSDAEKTNIEAMMSVALKAAEKSKNIGGKGVGAVISYKGRVLAVGCDARNLHPLKHATLAAIDMVAWAKQTDRGEPLDWTGPELAECNLEVLNSAEAYLCTDYDVFLTREPCTFCAMALLHNRVKRIFYGCSCAHGALGSAFKLHTLPDINHRYEVFGGVMEKQCLEVLSNCVMRHSCFS